MAAAGWVLAPSCALAFSPAGQPLLLSSWHVWAGCADECLGMFWDTGFMARRPCRRLVCTPPGAWRLAGLGLEGGQGSPPKGCGFWLVPVLLVCMVAASYIRVWVLVCLAVPCRSVCATACPAGRRSASCSVAAANMCLGYLPDCYVCLCPSLPPQCDGDGGNVSTAGREQVCGTPVTSSVFIAGIMHMPWRAPSRQGAAPDHSFCRRAKRLVGT